MKINVFVFKNKKLKCSGQPIFDDHEADVFTTQIERFLMVGPAEKVAQYTNTDLYQIGSYDDETLVFVPCELVKLLDCNLILDTRDVKTEIIENVSKEEVNQDGSSN